MIMFMLIISYNIRLDWKFKSVCQGWKWQFMLSSNTKISVSG